MGFGSGAKHVTNGLEYYYDAFSWNRSWQGKPTTNLVTDTPSQNGWSGSYTLIDSATKTFEVKIQQNSAATPSAWRTHYWSVSSYVGQTVTISMDVELISETDCTFSRTAVGQGNTGSYPYHIAGSPAADKMELTSLPRKTHFTWTGTINATGVVGISTWLTNVSANNANVVLRISNVMIEAGVKSPFINGTRSNTQALRDLTGQHTTTVTSLTYNNDETFEFTNTNQDKITVTSSERLTPRGVYGVEAWVWANSSQNNPYPRIFDKGHILLHIGNSFPTTFALNTTVNDGSNTLRQIASPNSPLPHSTWTHIHANYDGRYARQYVNGVLDYTRDFSTVEDILDTSNFDLIIGSNSSTGRDFNGKISDFKFYNRVLTAEEVHQNYHVGLRKYQ